MRYHTALPTIQRAISTHDERRNHASIFASCSVHTMIAVLRAAPRSRPSSRCPTVCCWARGARKRALRPGAAAGPARHPHQRRSSLELPFRRGPGQQRLPQGDGLRARPGQTGILTAGGTKADGQALGRRRRPARDPVGEGLRRQVQPHARSRGRRHQRRRRLRHRRRHPRPGRRRGARTATATAASRSRRLDAEPNTFVHEIEIGDLERRRRARDLCHAERCPTSSTALLSRASSPATSRAPTRAERRRRSRRPPRQGDPGGRRRRRRQRRALRLGRGGRRRPRRDPALRRRHRPDRGHADRRASTTSSDPLPHRRRHRRRRGQGDGGRGQQERSVAPAPRRRPARRVVDRVRSTATPAASSTPRSSPTSTATESTSSTSPTTTTVRSTATCGWMARRSARAALHPPRRPVGLHLEHHAGPYGVDSNTLESFEF